jgi:signal transduction histidine kinase
MQLTFRTKLLLGQLALVAIVMLVVTLVLDRSLTADLHRRLESRLEQQARGAIPWMKQNRHPEKLAARVADLVGAQVTIYSDTGEVLAVTEEGLDAMPAAEVEEARITGMGHATRAEQSGLMTHVAVDVDPGVLRLSAPMSSIDETVAGVRTQLIYATLLGALAAVALALLGAAVAARPLRKMTMAADRIARGEYDVELPPHTPDDFGVLSHALDTLAKKLRRDVTRIEQLERVRRDFIANVSHELRTPVTAIQGCAETLIDSDGHEAVRRDFLETIQRHAHRLGVLVARILQLSELEARSPDDIVAEPVYVRAIVKHAVRAAEARAPGAVRLEIDVPDDLMALADPLGVEQVIDNLLDNAIKYGPQGGVVRIEGRADEDEVVLQVIDRGAGIGPEHLPRLFERFYRVDKARGRADKGGSGLGLAIVKHLCEAMCGSVTVESTVGEGTRFTVCLPTVRTSAVTTL